MSSGISFWGLLGIAFVVLKLCKIITWSWWIVTLPLWGGLALACFVIILIALFFGIKELVNDHSVRR
jgi:hypothetical protein